MFDEKATADPISTLPAGAIALTMRRIFPIGVSVALSLLGDLSLFAILVTELDTLHLTIAQAGVLLSVHRLVRIPANPLVGMLQDRIGRRPIFLIGMLLAVASTTAYGWVSGFLPWLLSRIAWGFAWACIHVSGTTLALDLSDGETRGRMAGAYNTWLWIGYALAPLAGSLIASRVGFQPAMLICAAITALGCLLAFWQVPETLSDIERKSTQKGENAWASLSRAFSSQSASSEIKKAQLTYALTQFAGDGVVLSTTTVLLKTQLGEGLNLGFFFLSVATISGALLALRSILGGGASPLFGWISDRLRRRQPVIILGLLLTAGGFVLLAFSHHPMLTLLGIGLTTLGNAACWVALPSLIGDQTAAEDRGSQMGRLALAGDIGSTAGPLAALAVAPHVGLEPIYFFCAAVFLAALWVWRPQRGS